MRIDWLDGGTRAIGCPVCKTTALKRARLSVESLTPGQDRLTLVECPKCGVAFYDHPTSAPYEEPAATARSLTFYVEQGAGIDVMVGTLFCFDPGRVRDYLEVGCGFGYSLDFARFAFGWKVRGVDPSPMAAAGAEALRLNITPAYLTPDTDFGGTAFDLILCSEVIEHVPNPHDFLTVVGRLLAVDGALTLTTPNVAALRPTTSSAALLPILSPGHHLILFSKASLERVLKANGFAHVQVWESPHTLRAVASRHPYPIRDSAEIDRALYCRYLTERSGGTPSDTPVGLGFAYRLFKECVHASDFAGAQRAFERLRTSYAALYGLDPAAPRQIVGPDTPRDFGGFAATHPFNLTGVLFFRGIVEMNHRADYQAGVDAFRAAARAGVAVRTALRSIGADDGETEHLTWLARIHEVYCLAHLDPAAALGGLEALGTPPRAGDPPPELWQIPADLLADAGDQVAARLANLGYHPDAPPVGGTPREAGPRAGPTRLWTLVHRLARAARTTGRRIAGPRR